MNAYNAVTHTTMYEHVCTYLKYTYTYVQFTSVRLHMSACTVVTYTNMCVHTHVNCICLNTNVHECTSGYGHIGISLIPYTSYASCR